MGTISFYGYRPILLEEMHIKVCIIYDKLKAYHRDTLMNSALGEIIC